MTHPSASSLSALLFEQALRLEAEGQSAQALQFMQQALSTAEEALRQSPQDAGLWLDFALMLEKLRQTEPAKAALQACARLTPEDDAVLPPLADALLRLGLLAEGEAAFRRLLGRHPTLAAGHNNLGSCLRGLGRPDEAIEAYRRAVACDPTLAVAHHNLAGLLMDRDALDEAVTHSRRALELTPDLAAAHLNLGVALFRLRRPAEAEQAYAEAITRDPDNALARYNRAHALLTAGRYAEGFAEYEWRWRYDGFPSPRRSYPQPRWRGEAEVTLLVTAEQGLGDLLQFCRLLPLAAKRVQRLLFLCPSALVEVLAGLEGVEIIPEGGDLPPFDAWSPLISLCPTLGAGVEIAPPYLPLPPVDRLEGRNVGLIWRGNPKNPRDHMRSLPIESLRGLPRRDGLRYHCLQYQPPPGWQDVLGADVVDHGDALGDMTGLATVMAQMDLVISIDSAPLHLAGALGIPAWGLITYLPDWRWGLERADSLWYPGRMRLFRQQARHDWSGALADLFAAL